VDRESPNSSSIEIRNAFLCRLAPRQRFLARDDRPKDDAGSICDSRVIEAHYSDRADRAGGLLYARARGRAKEELLDPRATRVRGGAAYTGPMGLADRRPGFNPCVL
jgi:hypothetical protein